MTVYLHIGFPKCGSTSLQKWLAKNRKCLGTIGIHYPDLWKRESSHGAFYANFFSGLEIFRNARWKSRPNPPESLDQLMRNFDPGNKRYLVSSAEGLSILPSEEMKNLRSIFSPWTDDIKIVAYVRHPLDWSASMIQQKIKGGYHTGTVAELLENPPVPSYRRRLTPFLEEFGRENVIVRNFTRDQLIGGSVITDFLSLLDVDSTSLTKDSLPESNTAISDQALLVVEEINRILPSCTNQGSNPDRKKLRNLEILLRRIPGNQFQLPASTRIQTLEKVRKDVAWLHELVGEEWFSIDLNESHLSEGNYMNLSISPESMAKGFIEAARMIQELSDRNEWLESQQSGNKMAELQ